MVLSFAINKYVYVMVNKKFDDHFRVTYSKTENVDTIDQIEHDLIRETLRYAKAENGLEVVTVADIPGSGTGLGSSSALTVGLLNCLHRRYMKKADFNGGEPSKNWLAETAFMIESEKCHKPVGKQDHYAAALGGFNMIQFSKKSVKYTEVASRWDCNNPWSQGDLEEYMFLLWTGISRPSSDILQIQKDNFSSGKTIEFGKDMINVAKKVYTYLLDGEIHLAAEQLNNGWEIKKRFSPWISNEWIDNWYQLAMNNGAWGGKLCGAGGGGFLLFVAPPDTHDRIVKATGLRKIDFKIENEGSVIIKRAGWEASEL